MRHWSDRFLRPDQHVVVCPVQTTCKAPLARHERLGYIHRTSASWRSGYAADCKSNTVPCENNSLAQIGYQDIAGTQREPDNRPKSRSALSLYAKDGHRRAARSFGYALTLGTSDAWLDFATIIGARLTDQERAGLAYAALRSLDDETHARVVEAAIRTAGAQLPTFLKPMDDAEWWAGQANVHELKAYIWAAFWALPWSARVAFLRQVQGRAAA